MMVLSTAAEWSGMSWYEISRRDDRRGYDIPAKFLRRWICVWLWVESYVELSVELCAELCVES